MATIREVAKYAEVSVATVSRVLNNRGYVHEDTRKRVEEAIKALNYTPNSVARSLFNKKSKTVGFIVPDITNPYFPQLIRAVEDVMNELGYTIILCNSDENLSKELHYLEVFKQKYVDGVLIVSNTLEHHHTKDLDIPIVALDRYYHEQVPSITIDNYKEARKAVHYLQTIGCKHIAHVCGPEYIENANERKRGYIDQMGESTTWIINGYYDVKQTLDAVEAFLIKHTYIDAIFAGNDVMAVGALKAAQHLKFRIPEQLSIIGFDGIELSEVTTPEITTIIQPIYEMGKRAANMLLDLMEGQLVSERHVIFQAELAIRQSTKKGATR